MTKTNNAKKIDTTKNDVVANDKILTIADVARELQIDPKRARAFLRKHVELYTMRKLKFTKTSKLYDDAKNALTTYKNKNVVATK